MDARKFFYSCAGILCLVIAYQLGAKRAEADWQVTGSVIGTSSGRLVWNAAGKCYYLGSSSGPWQRKPNYDLPLPASDVKILEEDESGGVAMLVTTSDVVWFNDGASWYQTPPVPTGPVSVQPQSLDQSFGATKAKFRK